MRSNEVRSGLIAEDLAHCNLIPLVVPIVKPFLQIESHGGPDHKFVSLLYSTGPNSSQPHEINKCSNYRLNGGLDGRKYHSGGTVTFKNVQSFRASFYVDTTTFDFVSKGTIYLNIGDVWYNIEEPDLLTKLEITTDDIYPLKWQTDRPLDYHVEPPFTLPT